MATIYISNEQKTAMPAAQTWGEYSKQNPESHFKIHKHRKHHGLIGVTVTTNYIERHT